MHCSLSRGLSAILVLLGRGHGESALRDLPEATPEIEHAQLFIKTLDRREEGPDVIPRLLESSVFIQLQERHAAVIFSFAVVVKDEIF